jgi:hypothetical protein
MTYINVFEEVSRLSEIEDDKKFTDEEVARLFLYFKDIENIPGAISALTRCKNDKIKLIYLRSLLNSGMFLN